MGPHSYFAEDVFSGQNCEEIGEWCPGNRGEEKMASRLISSKSHAWLTIVSEMRLTFTNWAQAERKAKGLSTCSMTSMEHTTSNRFGSLTSCSAQACRYSNELPDEDS